MPKIGNKVKIKSTGEIMEVRDILIDGDILVGVWDSGCWMVKPVSCTDIEFCY